MNPSNDDNKDLAVNVIREKLAHLYEDEPNAAVERAEASVAVTRSKHQEHMYQLNTSGADLATIQTKWHEYYQSLPDNEKYEVWQEFYDQQSALTGRVPAHNESARGVSTESAVEAKAEVPLADSTYPPAGMASGAVTAVTVAQPIDPGKITRARQRTIEQRAVSAKTPRTHQQARKEAIAKAAATKKPNKKAEVAKIQATIKSTVTANGKLKAKHHIQSLLFGLGMAALVTIIFMFGFFNEIIIAPFMQPSRAHTSTPMIVDASSKPPTNDPEVIIPKINVEIPVNYTETSTNENDIENDLEGGVVHYPSTVMPGQLGNAAFFGHSSNNIFNKGKYKFAFVLLHTMVEGDTFYLSYNGQMYAYKVISKTIVPPTDVGVLGPVPGQTATATLITCDPPGTSLNRLVVVGQQISPDPSGNQTASASVGNTTTPVDSSDKTTLGDTPAVLPGNGPTLWAKFIGSILGKAVAVIVVIVILLYASRKIFSDRIFYLLSRGK